MVSINCLSLQDGDQLLLQDGSGCLLLQLFVEAIKKVRDAGRRKRKWFIEIDGEIFVVNSIAEAQRILALAVETVEQSVEKLDIIPEKPVIRIRTGAGTKTTSKPLRRAVTKARTQINRQLERIKANREAEHRLDAEIGRLMRRKLKEEQDEEDIDIVLLS